MSQNSSIRSRCSTTVTLVPSAANMDAYSIPITPAPATTMDRGTRSRWTMPSESITVRSSKSTVAGRAGRVPVATTILSAVARPIRPWPSSTSIVCESVKYPVPGQLAAPHVDLAAHHMLGAGGQVRDRDVVLDPVALAVHLPLVQAGEVKHRLAQGLGRDRPCVQAHPADHVPALHDGGTAAELRRRDRGLLATWP